eukprot:746076-Hanusia_phi.AAC.2
MRVAAQPRQSPAPLSMGRLEKRLVADCRTWVNPSCSMILAGLEANGFAGLLAGIRVVTGQGRWSHKLHVKFSEEEGSEDVSRLPSCESCMPRKANGIEEMAELCASDRSPATISSLSFACSWRSAKMPNSSTRCLHRQQHF